MLIRRFTCLVVAAAMFAGCGQPAPIAAARSIAVPASAEPSPTPRGVSESASASVSAEPAETPKPSPAQRTVTLPEDVSMVINGMTVKVDPMIEMLSIVQYLSGYDKQFGRMTKIKTTYQDDINLAFGSYKEHDAVKFFNEAMINGFNYDKPPAACLYLNKDFSIDSDYENSSFAKNIMSVDMNRFRDVMEQFCVDTDFAEFFEAHQDFYDQIIEQYKIGFPKWDMIKTMEDYYGQAMASYNIVLVPLFHNGGFGLSVNRADGTHVYYHGGPARNGPSRASWNIPQFGSEKQIVDMVIHEFGHSFVPVNALDNVSMANELKRSEYLMEPIRGKMTSMAYGAWFAAYEELVLRAISIDIAMRNTDIPLEQYLQTERKQGFIYIDDVYEILQQYSDNRDKYPTFDLFVPVITDYLIEKHPKT